MTTLDALALGLLLERLEHAGAEGALLVDVGDRVDGLAVLLGDLEQPIGAVLAHGGGVGLDAEGVLVVLLEDLVVDGDVDHERHLAALGDGGDVEGDVALVGADQRHRALVDQPLRLGLAGLGLALGVARARAPARRRRAPRCRRRR